MPAIYDCESHKLINMTKRYPSSSKQDPFLKIQSGTLHHLFLAQLLSHTASFVSYAVSVTPKSQPSNRRKLSHHHGKTYLQ